jgi:hypothetical protein
MKEPIRGAQERRASGASDEVVETEEPIPSFAESWRLLWKIEVLRRIWYAVPFLAVSLIGFVSLASLLYSDVYRLDELQRGYLAAVVEPFQLLGLAVGARLGTRLFLKSPALIFRLLRWGSFIAAVLAALWAPTRRTSRFAIAAQVLLAGRGSGARPQHHRGVVHGDPAERPRRRGSPSAVVWVLPGLAVLPVIGCHRRSTGGSSWACS